MIDSVEFGEHAKKTIHMKISSKFVGYLRIKGVVGKVSSAIDKIQICGKLDFVKIPLKGENAIAKQKMDPKLEIQILSPISALQIKFSDIPKEVLGGEIFPIAIELLNAGPNLISDVYMVTDSPRNVIIEPKVLTEMPLSIEKGRFFLYHGRY